MATVVDAFVVTLGLDPSRFTQGQKDAMEALRKTKDQAVSGGKEIESQGAKVSEYFSSLKRQALGLAGLLIGGAGVKEFVQNLTTLEAATSRAARFLNMSAHELSAWEAAGRQSGAAAGSITGAMQGLNAEIEKFQLTGEGAFQAAFNSMGIATKDALGNVKTMSALFLEMRSAMKEMSPARLSQAQARLMLIPGMNQDTINLLTHGRFAEFLEFGKRVSNVTAESAAEAEKLASAWAKVTIQSENVGRAILNKMTPAMQTFLGLATYAGAKIAGVPLLTEPPEEKAKREKADADFKRDADKKYSRPTVPSPWHLWSKLWESGSSPGARGSGAEPSEVWTGQRTPASATPPKPETVPGLSNLFIPQASAKAFTGALGGKMVPITTNGGRKVTVAEESADAFLGFLNEMEAKGAPIGNLGGYNPRKIFGTNVPSEHGKGNAVDIGSMTGRDKIDPALRSWIEANEPTWRDMLSRYNLKSGGDFKNPDLGHVERANSGFGSAGAVTNDNRRTSGNVSTTTISIGKVELPNVTDAQSFARDIGPLLARGNTAASANYALTG